MTNNFKSTITPALLKGIAEEYGKATTENIAQKVFSESQNRCPVSSGKLKNSVYQHETKTGYEVGYTADYALYIDQVPQALSNGTSHFLSGSLEKALKEGLS